MVREEEPVSPSSRIILVGSIDFGILVVIGFSTTIDVAYFKLCMEQTIIKHPRFSSVIDVKSKKRHEFTWKRTKVNLDNHVFVQDLDHNIEFPDKFVEDFTSDLSTEPFDFSKPLWEVHILNLKLCDANSVAIFKIHHSMGDGVSIISLFLACSRKVSDPESRPFIETKKREAQEHINVIHKFGLWFWSLILLIYYTIVEMCRDIALLIFSNNENNPFRHQKYLDQPRNRYAHKIVSLDDLKMIRKAMNSTINDVLLGATEFALCEYMKRQYETWGEDNKSLKKSGIILGVAVNLRDTFTVEGLHDVMEKGKELDRTKWGNLFSIWIIQLKNFEDPLNYIREVKSKMDKKKMACSPKSLIFILKLLTMLFGGQVAAKLMRRLYSFLSVAVSNIVGASEEIVLFGHHVSYIAPTILGFPVGVCIHYHSYDKKMIISIAVKEELVRDPHQILEYMIEYLDNVKRIVMENIVDV